MIEIQTKNEILYNARENHFGRVIIRMESIPSEAGYDVTITDFAERSVVTKDQDGNDVAGTVSLKLQSKVLNIPSAEINQLYGYVDAIVPKSMPYFERERELQRAALLAYVSSDFVRDQNGQQVQGKTIYGLSPTDWEIRRQ